MTLQETIEHYAERVAHGDEPPSLKQIKMDQSVGTSRAGEIRQLIISASAKVRNNLLHWPSDCPPVPEWQR